ncbi:MAG: site-specific integrase [Candidatus Methanoperedens sp.]|nr:site-specific integrase [Candidatus Methanoperedens sp.]
MTKLNSDSMKVTSYLNELKINGVSDSTIEYYTSVLKDANTFKTLPKWSRDDVNAYFMALGSKNKQSSIELKKGVIKKFLTWVGRKDAVDHLKAKMPRNNLKREELLTVDDIDKLVEAADSPQWKALIAFLFETGCRIGEAVRMKVSDVQESDKGLIASITTTKTNAGIRRTLLVYSATYIRNHLSYSGLSKDDRLFGVGDEWVRIVLKRVAEKAGIDKPMSPHKFRHASVTYAALKGYNEDIIRKKYGWSANSTVPSRYLHLIDEDVIDAELAKEGSGLKPRIIPNIKQGESLKIADASMQLSRLADENENLKAELKEMQEWRVKQERKSQEVLNLILAQERKREKS